MKVMKLGAALACLAISIHFFALGMTSNGVFLALGALAFASLVPGPGQRVRDAVKARVVAGAFGVFALAVGMGAVFYSVRLSYLIFDERLESGWSQRAALTTQPASTQDGIAPCTGRVAIGVRSSQPNDGILLYHNFVPVDRSRHPVEAIEFAASADMLDGESLAVALETGPSGHTPKDGLALGRNRGWYTGEVGQCGRFRIPLSDFGLGDRPLYGIRFLIRRPGLLVLDAIKLLPPPGPAPAPQAVPTERPLPERPSDLPLGLKVLLAYALIGVCTQIPGTLYGHFLRGPLRQYAGAPPLVKMILGLYWLAISVSLWPRPFLAAGLNLIALELLGVGLIASVLILHFASTWSMAGLIACLAPVAAVVIARRRGLRG